MLPSPEHPRYRPDIDGLRALAILPVVVFHAFPRYAPGGFVGVDIFFVISGYLISLILFKSLEAGEFSLREFYAHRVRRLFPALLAVLGVSYAFGWFALLPEEFKQLGKHMAAGVGFVQNLVLWRETGYFDTASEFKPLLHLWSLAVEEQFYLLFPLLAWLFWRTGLNFLTGVLAIGAISFVLASKGVHTDAVKTFFFVHTRFWELMSGALLAHFHSVGTWPSRLTGWVRQAVFNRIFFRHAPSAERQWPVLASPLSALGLALIVYAVFTFDASQPYPGGRALAPVSGAFLLILAGPTAWVNRRLLALRPMVWVGLISYPLYLWHWPILSFLRIMEGETPTRAWRIGAVLLAFILAAATYLWIEKPIRYGSGRGWKTGILVALAVLIGLIGSNTWLHDGYPSRIKGFSLPDPKDGPGWLPEKQNKSCLAGFRPDVEEKYRNLVFCRKDADGGTTNVLLLGDSHAASLYPGLAEVLAGSHWVVEHNGGAGTVPLRGLVIGTNNNLLLVREHITETMLGRVLDSEVSTVILVGRWPWYYHAVGFGKTAAGSERDVRSYRRPELTDPPAIFEDALRTTLSELAARNKRVIFVLDSPELDFHPKSCVVIRPLRLSTNTLRSFCAVPREEFEARQAGYRALVKNVLADYPQVIVVDAAKPFCDEQWCWAMKDGEVLYYDHNHVSLPGARLIAREILPHLNAMR